MDATDTARLSLVLSREGFVLDSILAVRGAHMAVIATDEASRRFVAVVDDGGSSLSLVGGPEELPMGFAPGQAAWLALGDDDKPLLILRFELPSEGVVGTVVKRVDGNELATVYADPVSVCRPATLRDLDGDGVPELIAYPEDASAGDCSAECHGELEERFGIGPSWVRVHGWTGRFWEPAENRFPEFYAELAETYAGVLEWIEANDPEQGRLGEDAARCVRAVPWFSAEPFREWRRRAATPGSRPVGRSTRPTSERERLWLDGDSPGATKLGALCAGACHPPCGGVA